MQTIHTWFKRLKKISLFLLIIILCSHLFSKDIIRFAEKNILYSNTLPHLLIELDMSFTYLGKINFKIKDIAEGQRYIFVNASPDKKVYRLFIAQFENILPNSNQIYNYSFSQALQIDGIKCKHNMFAFSNKEAIKQKPQGEAALTYHYLKNKGFELEDEWITSRFVTVTDEKRKHELILFYVENLSETGFRILELYEDNHYSKLGEKVCKQIKGRSLNSFNIFNLNQSP